MVLGGADLGSHHRHAGPDPASTFISADVRRGAGRWTRIKSGVTKREDAPAREPGDSLVTVADDGAMWTRKVWHFPLKMRDV
jgi:hypothetical protein